jgi:hypothetical protein
LIVDSLLNITAEQILTSLAATLAFIPVTVCTGYLTAWLTDLHGFRRRSLVERLCWSIPLSLAVSTITSVLVGRFLSLTAATVLILLCSIACLAVLIQEHLHLRRIAQRWHIGLRPVGQTILLLALCFVAFEIFSLVDIQRGQRLYLSLTFYDVAPRTNWANSVLRTGIPPANPHYFYLHAANLRYYYFWLVNCAVVAKFSRLPMRSIVNAGCIWSGFALTALTGLYLKHFLVVGDRLRRQFYIAALLPAVGGFSLCIFFWNMLVLHIPAPADVWYPGQIADLVSFPLFYPHHLAGMVLCMFAFLLAGLPARRPVRHPAADPNPNTQPRWTTILFIALALASAFGISVYTTFAFFLIVLCWSAWQVIFHRSWRSPLLLLAGGALSLILLLPYLYEITHSPSKMAGDSVTASGASAPSTTTKASPFLLSIRETIPPDRLARILSNPPTPTARSIAKLILLPPGFALELGLYSIVLLVFLLRRRQLPTPHRTLLFIVLVTLPITAFIRSAVLSVNDFGIHSALFIQYPLLLLASELLIAFKPAPSAPNLAPSVPNPAPDTTPDPRPALILPPPFLRSIITLAILVGVLSSCWRVAVLRFLLPIADIAAASASNPHVAALPHKAYISYLGYAALNRRIPQDAVVQFSPLDDWNFWKNVDYANVNRQTAITGDQLWCGSELGGDPSGCPAMLSAIVPIFRGETADQARAVCRAWHIDYLITTIYDPAWHDPNSWVWKLNPVLANPEFRALDCRSQSETSMTTPHGSAR